MSSQALKHHEQIGTMARWLDQSLMGYHRRLAEDADLSRIIESAVAEVEFFRTKRFPTPLDLGAFRTCLYALTRSCRPSRVIETGVLHGLTSLFILRGLRENRSGQLVSVDLPSAYGNAPANLDGCTDTLPPGRNPGWVVDPLHAKHWQLVLGSSLDVLPGILSEKPVDLFLHDSDHTETVMGGELRLAWAHASPRAVIVCDNIDMCPAFDVFCREIGQEPLKIPEDPGGAARFGMVRKPQ